MKNLKRLSDFTLMLLSVFVLLACKKDKLTNDLDAYEGRFTWEYTLFKENWWDSDFTKRNASQFDYVAEIEFNNEGKLFLYIDGEEVHKTGFSVESNETLDGTISLKIKPAKKNSKDIDLPKYLELTLKNDTLSMGDFPAKSYDQSFSGTHYFLRN